MNVEAFRPSSHASNCLAEMIGTDDGAFGSRLLLVCDWAEARAASSWGSVSPSVWKLVPKAP